MRKKKEKGEEERGREEGGEKRRERGEGGEKRKKERARGGKGGLGEVRKRVSRGRGAGWGRSGRRDGGGLPRRATKGVRSGPRRPRGFGHSHVGDA
uniref:hypothetical protein n=1 Tax=Salmonella enterica TaxID=28901 RepID=UPI00398C3E98